MRINIFMIFASFKSLRTKQNMWSLRVCLNYYKNVYDYNIYAQITIIMSHLFICMNFIHFQKYYKDVLSTKDILSINNLLTKS